MNILQILVLIWQIIFHKLTIIFSKFLQVAACSHLLFKKYVKKMLFLALTMLNLTPHDEIPPKFVKLSKCILAPLLTKLFNKCFKQEIFPNPFKLACVIPILKITNPKSLDDLRPISLLPVFGKIFENI